MAANMIGIRKRIIAVSEGTAIIVMLNPKIIRKSGKYETEESCLSLQGARKTTRFRTITLSWQDVQMRTHTGILNGFQAQIVQHEIDHCEGILI